jgi:phytanoyl-CoA hydroxylase
MATADVLQAISVVEESIMPPPTQANDLNHSHGHDRLPPLQQTDEGGDLTQESLGWLHPTPITTPLDEIRARYGRDGYVWLKNVLPRDDVLYMRERYFTLLDAETHVLEPGTSSRNGIFDRAVTDNLKHQSVGATPDDTAKQVFDKIHSDPVYRQFLEHKDLRDWVRRLTGWNEEVLLKRALLRHNVPASSKAPSGIHYDQLFLRAGEPVFVTAWVPIGNCAADGGGLMYLEDSLGLGQEIERDFAKRQESESMTREERVSAFNRHMNGDGHLSHNVKEWTKANGGSGQVGTKTDTKQTAGRRWLVADYEAGDVVFHSPWMIHAASRNNDRDGRIRLSTDLRFYEKGAKLDERWMQHFFYLGDGL